MLSGFELYPRWVPLNNFHNKGFELSLAFKQTPGATWKWPNNQKFPKTSVLLDSRPQRRQKMTCSILFNFLRLCKVGLHFAIVFTTLPYLFLILC